MLIGVNDSIASAIRKLVANHHQCLLIAHENKLLGVLSYADIIDFMIQFDRN
jgi:CBS domain-containing protein